MLILPPGHGRAVAAAWRPGRNERIYLGIAGALAVVLLVVVVVSLAGGSSAPRRGCLDVTFGSSTGAGEIRGCGATARATCAEVGTPRGYSGVVARALAQRCRALGFPVGS